MVGGDEDNLPYPNVVALREDTQTASHREIVLEPIWNWQVVNDKLKQGDNQLELYSSDRASAELNGTIIEL